MKRVHLLTMQAFASVLILFLSACAEEPLGGNDQTGKGHTITLRLSATVAPIPETKAIVIPAHPNSEAETAGFYYEMVSSDAETVAETPGFDLEILPNEEDSSEINFTPKELATKVLATKAPRALKNAYGLLFTSTGAFNGHAEIGAFTVGTPKDITFTKVANPAVTGCRLLIVANDNAAVTNYASTAGTGGFADFTGIYADFQRLTITSEISKDEDVPYAGSATVDLSQSEMGMIAEVPLFRTLAKVTLYNKLFQIDGGPARSKITLYNAGERRFATSDSDPYEGTGTTETTVFLPSIDGGNADVTTWYVGENIRPAGVDISSTADRNSRKAPANACYIEIRSASIAVPENTTPKIGEEYTPKGGGKAFNYDIFLGKSTDISDFSLRRHTDYTITTTVSGTLASQKQLAAMDERITFSSGAGLVIGRFGGPLYYTAVPGHSISISGSYTKFLLLEPNNTRSSATDNIKKIWGIEGNQYQLDNRKLWDRTYIYSINTDGTIGGMSTAADDLYAYCNELTLGGVAKGTWYVPTQVQLQMVWAVYGGMKEGGFADYSAFEADNYWCSSESTAESAWFVRFSSGSNTYDYGKAPLYGVRCVRDL